MAVYNADHNDIIRANGLDAYFFVRFLRMMVRVFLPIWVLSWIVLLPTTSVNINPINNTGLDQFIFGNVSTSQQERYAAHIILVYLFTGVLYHFFMT